LRNTIRKVFFSIAFFAELAFALNEASAYSVYEYGRMLEADFNSEKINLNAKVLRHDPFSFNWRSTDVKSTVIESDGGEIVFLSASFPVSLNSYILEPSFLFGKGVWERGDFQYFYGKPDLPQVLGFGMSLCHGLNSLHLHYILGSAKILSNNEKWELFNSDFYIYNIFYKLGANKNFNISAGFMGLNAKASGTLTAANQGYFLFPYSFYEASGKLNAQAAYAIANLKLESKIAEYGLSAGALTIASGKLTGSMHYKYRKFFGTDEHFETLTPAQIKNNGIAFSVLSIKTKKISIGKSYIQYGVQKPIATLFGDAFPKSSAEEGEASLKDAFLWGLTVNMSLYF
jgi:hypothetical protein